MSVRDEDFRLLRRLLKGDNAPERDRDTFEDMLVRLETRKQHILSAKQRKWVKDLLDEPEYENLFSAGSVPRGREVHTPAVLLNRPLKPPGRS